MATTEPMQKALGTMALAALLSVAPCAQAQDDKRRAGDIYQPPPPDSCEIGDVIPHCARDTIWDGLPRMQAAIDLINDQRSRNYTDYVMFPNSEFGDIYNRGTTLRKIPREDMATPQYWLLLKKYTGRMYLGTGPEEFGGGREAVSISYDRYFAAGERLREDPTLIKYTGLHHAGIPPLAPNTGLWHFARSLMVTNEEAEADLLKALFIGATGSPDGAQAIIDSSFRDMPNVRAKVREWEKDHDFAPYSDEGNLLAGYVTLALLGEDERRKTLEDRNLFELTLGMLSDFYQDIGSYEESAIYGGNLPATLNARGLASYHRFDGGRVYFPVNIAFSPIGYKKTPLRQRWPNRR